MPATLHGAGGGSALIHKDFFGFMRAKRRFGGTVGGPELAFVRGACGKLLWDRHLQGVLSTCPDYRRGLRRDPESGEHRNQSTCPDYRRGLRLSCRNSGFRFGPRAPITEGD